MATCADCVHVEVCSEYVEGLAAVRGLKLGDVEEISAILQCDDCDHFKDRSRFVELEKCENNEILTLDDAITHCYDIADGKTGACEDCRAEHMMLGSWLRELKLRRELELQNPPQLAALPCVGDKVYELCRINQFGDYKIDESEIKGFIVDTNRTAFDYELLGEKFFLTREEAEQALKERESHGQSQN
jgi:hypothetical protein